MEGWYPFFSLSKSIRMFLNFRMPFDGALCSPFGLECLRIAGLVHTVFPDQKAPEQHGNTCADAGDELRDGIRTEGEQRRRGADELQNGKDHQADTDIVCTRDRQSHGSILPERY